MATFNELSREHLVEKILLRKCEVWRFLGNLFGINLAVHGF